MSTDEARRRELCRIGEASRLVASKMGVEASVQLPGGKVEGLRRERLREEGEGPQLIGFKWRTL